MFQKTLQLLVLGVFAFFFIITPLQAQTPQEEHKEKPPVATRLMVSPEKVPEPKESSAREAKQPKHSKITNFDEARDSINGSKVDTTQNKTLVYLEHTDSILFDKDRLPNIQLLKGHVKMSHKGAFLYCDSAYFSASVNSFTAFGHVVIVQGDSISIYGDKLFYDGNSSMARLRENVRLVNKTVVLTTDSLNYDRNRNVSYYFGGGKIVETENTLTSLFGYYYPEYDIALFQNTVHAFNTVSQIYSDTLQYDTRRHLVSLQGPTNIEYKDSTFIYAEDGWYHMEYSRAQIMKHASVKQNNGRQLFGDTIFFDNKTQLGKAFSSVTLKDTVAQLSLLGNYGYFQRENALGIVTDSALLVDYANEDTTYMHADTLVTYADSIYNKALAYNNVRLYNHAMQAVCDSVIYSTRDSIINLYSQPYLYADSLQLNGDTIRLHSDSSGAISFAEIISKAFVVHLIDSVKFDQLSGNNVTAFFSEGKLGHILLSGNAETLFFPVENGRIIGLNRTKSSYLDAYLKEGKIDRFVLRLKPQASLTPLKEITKSDLYLMNYSWYPEWRPLKWQDVFLSPERGLINFSDQLRQEERRKERKLRDKERKRRRILRTQGNDSELIKSEAEDEKLSSPFDTKNSNGFLN